MFCRACNTRLEPGSRICPNCGRTSALPSTFAATAAPREPDSLAHTQRAAAELELFDEVDLAAGKGATPVPTGEPLPVSEASFTLFRLDPMELRARIAEHPELLEPGLAVVADAQGRPVGAGYPTEVGEIDLLARDARGGYVVVVIAEPDRSRDPVAEVLQRLGWVRKHLGRNVPSVRGIVLLDPALVDLSYAAAAIADTVSFKTYRVALAFDDIAL